MAACFGDKSRTFIHAKYKVIYTTFMCIHPCLPEYLLEIQNISHLLYLMKDALFNTSTASRKMIYMLYTLVKIRSLTYLNRAKSFLKGENIKVLAMVVK